MTDNEVRQRVERVSQEAVLGEVAHRAARESIGGASVIRPLPSRTFHARHRQWQEQQAELQSHFPTWVKLGRTQSEQMSSGLAPTTDIARCSRHVSNVPLATDAQARI
jgi:hypothetical protein